MQLEIPYGMRLSTYSGIPVEKEKNKKRPSIINNRQRTITPHKKLFIIIFFLSLRSMTLENEKKILNLPRLL